MVVLALPLAAGAAGSEHVGAGSCAASMCHGAATASRTGRILQNEFTTWLRQDAHANAYRLLLSEQGQRIAANLGIGAASDAAECLGCHTDAVPKERRGPLYRAADGVSCESCHGGAGPWLKPHADPGRAGATTRPEGMYPLDAPLARARVCLSCHAGDREHPIGHRVMSAGHPRLSFELDTFTAIEPAHFVVDEDYRRRKQDAGDAAAWIAGQLVASELLLDGLSARFTQDLFPELVFYDCFSCHRLLPGPGGASSASRVDGQPHLDATPLRLTARILAVLLPAKVDDWTGAVTALEQASAQSPQQLRDAAVRLDALLREAQSPLQKRDIAASDARALLESVVALGTDRSGDLILAEQIAMALGALANQLAAGHPGSSAQIKPALDEVFATVAKPAHFEPARFQVALARFHQAATRLFGSP